MHVRIHEAQKHNECQCRCVYMFVFCFEAFVTFAVRPGKFDGISHLVVSSLRRVVHVRFMLAVRGFVSRLTTQGC